MLTDLNRNTVLVPILVLFLSGCRVGGAGAPTAQAIFDLPALAGGTAAAVDAALGTPTAIKAIERYPARMPGEFRSYELVGGACLVTVRFYRERAVFFTVFLPKPETSAEAALQRVGIDVEGAEPDTRAPTVEWWRSGTIGGKQYVKVGALESMRSGSDDFDIVQAEFR